MTTWLYVLGIVIGVGGAVVGALLPALDVARRDTRALLSAFTLHETVGSLAPRLFALGAALPLTAAVWYGLHGRHWQHAGFVLAVVLLLTLPLLTPLLVRELCARVRVRGFGLGYSLKGLGVRLQTTSVAVASLAVAVSMLIGITLMIGSFRQTLKRVDRHLGPGGRVHRSGIVARHRRRQRRRPGAARDGRRHRPPGGAGGRPPAAFSRLHGR